MTFVGTEDLKRVPIEEIKLLDGTVVKFKQEIVNHFNYY